MNRRWVVVDDTDDQIYYQGDWALVRNAAEVNGYGWPFLRTQHVVQSASKASLSFNFMGTAVQLYGTSNGEIINGTIDPQWECFVDNVPIPPLKTDMAQHATNTLLCDYMDVTPGNHKLTLQVNSTGRHAFLFDDIQYLPLEEFPEGLGTVKVNSVDPSIRYDLGWETSGATHNTNVNGSTMTLTFTGTSVEWYGWRSGPAASGSADYWIDGAGPTSFQIQGVNDPIMPTRFNQLLFSTLSWPNGQHVLKVTYRGNQSLTPLSLDYLYVFGSPRARIAPSGSDLSPSAIGAIMGGVIGGIALLVFGIIFCHRRRNRVSYRQVEINQTGSPPPAVVPSFITPNSPTGSDAPSYTSHGAFDEQTMPYTGHDLTTPHSGQNYIGRTYPTSQVLLTHNAGIIFGDLPPSYTPT